MDRTEMETIIYINRNTTQKRSFSRLGIRETLFQMLCSSLASGETWAASSRLWPLCLKIKLKGVLKDSQIYGKDDTESLHRDSGWALSGGFAQTDGRSSSWLSSSVLVLCKLMHFNKSNFFIKQISVV